MITTTHWCTCISGLVEYVSMWFTPLAAVLSGMNGRADRRVQPRSQPGRHAHPVGIHPGVHHTCLVLWPPVYSLHLVPVHIACTSAPKPTCQPTARLTRHGWPHCPTSVRTQPAHASTLSRSEPPHVLPFQLLMIQLCTHTLYCIICMCLPSTRAPMTLFKPRCRFLGSTIHFIN